MMPGENEWHLEVLAPGNNRYGTGYDSCRSYDCGIRIWLICTVKKKWILYYSIPFRRKKLFMSGYMTGFLMFVGIFVASLKYFAVLVAAAKGVSPFTAVARFKGDALAVS